MSVLMVIQFAEDVKQRKKRLGNVGLIFEEANLALPRHPPPDHYHYQPLFIIFSFFLFFPPYFSTLYGFEFILWGKTLTLSKIKLKKNIVCFDVFILIRNLKKKMSYTFFRLKFESLFRSLFTPPPQPHPPSFFYSFFRLELRY